MNVQSVLGIRQPGPVDQMTENWTRKAAGFQPPNLAKAGRNAPLHPYAPVPASLATLQGKELLNLQDAQVGARSIEEFRNLPGTGVGPHQNGDRQNNNLYLTSINSIYQLGDQVDGETTQNLDAWEQRQYHQSEQAKQILLARQILSNQAQGWQHLSGHKASESEANNMGSKLGPCDLRSK